MEDNIDNNGAKSRARSNSARVLVFDEPRAYLEQKQRCNIIPTQDSGANQKRIPSGNLFSNPLITKNRYFLYIIIL